MASISVRNGTSTGITLNHNDYMTVASGGTAIDTTVKYAGYIFVSAGGVAESTTVSTGGTMDILEEGTANSTTVNIGGRIDVSSGGMANSTTVNSGGSMVVYSGGTATEIRENGGYVANRDGANATFVSNTIENLLFSDIDVTLHPVTTAYNALGKYNGHLFVFGGKAIHTTVSLNATIFVMSGGIATETSVNSDGFLEVDSGCTANSTTVNDGGGFSVASGGTANSTTVNDGGSMTVRGTANSTTIVSGGKLDIGVGGVMKNTVVSSGAYFILYNKDSIASNTTVCECGTLRVSNNATVDVATLNAGTMTIAWNGTAKGVIVNSDGNLTVFESGVANGATVSSGGSLCVSAGGTAQDTRVNGGIMWIKSDGTANGTLVNDGGLLHAGRGTLNNTTVYSGGTAIVSGNVGYQEFVVNGGELQVIEGGVMGQGFELTVMSRGRLIVRTEGIVDGAIIKESAVVTVGNGGILASAGVSAAKVTVYAGGCLDGVFLNSGSILDVSGGGSFVEDVCVSSGAVLTGVLHDPNVIDLTFSGGTLDLKIAKSSENDGFLVEGGAYSQFKTDTYSCTLTVANKQLNGTYKLIANAIGFNTTVTVKFGNNELGTLTVNGGPTDVGNITCDLKLDDGDLVVTVTGGAIPDPIVSGITLIDERRDITSGMSAIDVKVSAGGILNVFSKGTASNTTVYDGGEFNVHSKGDLRGATISSGGTATIYDDVMAAGVIVDGGVYVIESDGWAYRTSGGKLVSSNTIVKNGGTVIVSGGGHCGGVFVSDGGHIIVESDGNLGSAFITSGDVTVKDGVESAGASLLDGGVMVVQSGGSGGCIVSSGGIVKVESGGYLRALTVSTGGVVTGVLHDIYTVFRMYGGTLDLDISNAAPGGEYLMDDDANFDPNEDFNCTLTVDGSQANGTYNLMEYAYGFDTQVITAENPLTVKSASGATLGTLTVGQTAEIGGVTYTLNLSNDHHLTVTVSGGTPPPTPPPTPGDKSFFAGDFNGDLFDTLAVQSGSTVTIYQNGEAWGLGVTLDTGWSVVGTGDFNGDNLDDFLRVNTEGYVVGEMSNGNGTFTPQVLNLKNAGWDILGTGNFDGVGPDDVLIANPTAASDTVGLLGYWKGGTEWTLINGYSPEWTMVSTGDFNGDGKCDMLWKNQFVGEGGLTYNAYCTWIVEDPVDWRMVSVANPDEWNFLCSGDFDGNGSHDIAMINNVGVVGIWGVTDGYLSSWSILSAVTSEWTLAGVADFNADGTDDIAWSNTDTGLTGYWQINNKELTTWANIASL